MHTTRSLFITAPVCPPIPARMSTKMRAVVYEEPFKVTVREVEKPQIQHPCDVIVKGTPIVFYLHTRH